MDGSDHVLGETDLITDHSDLDRILVRTRHTAGCGGGSGTSELL